MNVKGLFTIFLFAFLFISALLWTAIEFGIYNPVFAFAITWIPNGLMVVLFPQWPIKFSEKYYSIRPFEIRLYKKLFIRSFKRFLQNRIYRAIVPEFQALSKRKSLSELYEKMCDAETAHLLTFIIALLFTVNALWHREFISVIWITGFNLILNGYPVMLQRYNRDRMQKILRQGS